MVDCRFDRSGRLASSGRRARLACLLIGDSMGISRAGPALLIASLSATGVAGFKASHRRPPMRGPRHPDGPMAPEVFSQWVLGLARRAMLSLCLVGEPLARRHPQISSIRSSARIFQASRPARFRASRERELTPEDDSRVRLRASSTLRASRRPSSRRTCGACSFCRPSVLARSVDSIFSDGPSPVVPKTGTTSAAGVSPEIRSLPAAVSQ